MSSKSPKISPNTVTFIALIVLVVGVYLIVIRNEDPYAPPVISSGPEYTKHLERVEELTKAPLEKYAAGEDLSDQDKDDLKKGAAIFRGLIGFQPNRYSLLLGAAMVNLAIGDNGLAHQNAQDAVVVIMNTAGNLKDKALKDAEAEAHYISSQALEREKLYPQAEAEADFAVSIYTTNPDYLSQAASVKVQLQKVAEAKELVRRALRSSPDHPRAKSLSMLLK